MGEVQRLPIGTDSTGSWSGSAWNNALALACGRMLWGVISSD